MTKTKYTYWLRDYGAILRSPTGGLSGLQRLFEDGWGVPAPTDMDAVTGMGEDPWSCGEWAEKISPQKARAAAKKQGFPFDIERPGAHTQLFAHGVTMKEASAD